jgi:hypothetical protein
LFLFLLFPLKLMKLIKVTRILIKIFLKI